MNRHPLYNPAKVPFAGRNSTVSPLVLRPGEWAEATNLRDRGRVLSVRDGSAILYSGTAVSPAAGDLPSGTVLGYLATAKHPLVAVTNGGHTDVYSWLSSDYILGSAWASSGGFSGTSRQITMAVFKTRDLPGIYGTQWLVAQNGYDAPRVGELLSSGATLRTVATLAAPLPETVQVKWGPSAYFNVLADSFTGTSFTSATSGTGKSAYRTITMPTSVVNTNVATVTYTTGVTTGGDGIGQFQMLVETTAEGLREFLGSCQVILETSGAVQHIISDPDTGKGRRAEYLVGTNVYFVTFNLADQTNGTLASATYNKLIFKYVASASPAAQVTLSILYAGFSGSVPYGTQFGVSYMEPDTLSESPGVVAKNTLPGKVQEYGGSQRGNYSLPASSAVQYVATIETRSNNGTTTNSRWINWYALDGGVYRHLTNETTTGVEGDASGTLKTKAVKKIVTGTYTMPDAFYKPIPVGDVMMSANQRLWVGNAVSAALGRGDLMVSDKDYPWRFRQVVQLDSDSELNYSSGAVISFEDQTVKAMVAFSGSVGGGDPVILLTDRGAYSMDSSDVFNLVAPRNISRHGTLSPRSVAVYQNSVVYLDSERQVRVLQSGYAKPISQDKIETDLLAIPAARISAACGWSSRDRYYLAVTPAAGSANTHIHVYDFRTGVWVKDTTSLNVEYAGLRTTATATAMSFVPQTVSASTGVYEYEKAGQATEAGSNLSVSLTSGYIHAGFTKEITTRRISILCDKVSGGSVSWGRVEWLSGTSGTSTSTDLAASVAGTIVSRYDVDGSGNNGGAHDLATQITLSASLPGGTRVYGLEVELQEAVDHIPDVSS